MDTSEELLNNITKYKKEKIYQDHLVYVGNVRKRILMKI